MLVNSFFFFNLIKVDANFWRNETYNLTLRYVKELPLQPVEIYIIMIINEEIIYYKFGRR